MAKILCIKDSRIESEFNSESEIRHSDSDREVMSDNDSDEFEFENIAKKRKILHRVESEEITTDETGHIKWHPGQQLKSYEIKAVLGEGSFGRVLRVKNVSTGQHAALKVVKDEQDKRKSAMAEIIALTVISCRDPLHKSFCINMLNWFHCGGHVCIAFPLLGCSVFDFIKDNNYEPFSMEEVRHISFQLCSAVLFLHNNGLIHTDLKPENMLFVDSSFTTVFCEKRKVELKRLKCTNIRLSDFGQVTRDNDYHQPLITTVYYRPPEVILRQDWTNTCDIWSIGCILLELHTGDMLFPAEESDELLAMMEKIIGKIPSEMTSVSNTSYFKNGVLNWNWDEAEEDSIEHCRPLDDFRLDDCAEVDELFHVIRKMLVHEPSRRMLLDEALSMQFFEKLPASKRMANSRT